MAIFVLAHVKINLETFISRLLPIRPAIFKRKYLRVYLLNASENENFSVLLFPCASNASNRMSLALFVHEIFALKVKKAPQKI